MGSNNVGMPQMSEDERHYLSGDKYYYYYSTMDKE